MTVWVDACAIVAILSEEPDADVYLGCLDAAERPTMSPLAAFEAVLVLARPEKFGCEFATALAIVLDFLDERGIALRMPTDARGLLTVSVEAAQRQGVGKRKLSTFDCFHFACAKLTGAPLLTLDRLLRDTGIEVTP